MANENKIAAQGLGEQYEYINGQYLLVFEGEFWGGKRHGRGRSFYPSGAIRYDGFFWNGKYHGQGKLYRPSGVLQYHGEFSDGKYGGLGAEYDEDGALIHSGAFADGFWYRGNFGCNAAVESDVVSQQFTTEMSDLTDEAAEHKPDFEIQSIVPRFKNM